MGAFRRFGTALGALLLAALVASFLLLSAEHGKRPSLRSVPPFAVRDLEGRVVTNEVFRRNRVTAVTVWRPGVRECDVWLEGAGVMAARLPEEAAVLGLLVGRRGLADADELAEARGIAAARTGAVVHLVADDSLAALLTEVRTLPITFFVDGDGRLVGHPVALGGPRHIEREIHALLDADPAEAAARQTVHTQIFR